MKKKPPQGALRRSMKLLGAAAQIAGKEAKQRLQKKWDEKAPEAIRHRVEQARILTDSLSELKGAAMKMGQLLSLDLSDLLPPEAVEILRTLQNKAQPIDHQVMIEIVKKELGEEKAKQLNGIGKSEVFAASIGQVYKASLLGQKVAVKIQYPTIAQSVDSDLSAVKKIINPLLKVSGRQMDVSGVFEEIKLMLQLETDYENEMNNLIKYRSLLTGFNDYLVPEPFADFSSARVLTMSWQEGLTIADWMKQSPTMEQRTQIARLILDLYIKEFFEWGFVQTDPNAGNFLVQPNPLKLVLLDLGSAKHYERPFIDSYRQLLEVFAQRDIAKTVQAAIDFDLIRPEESKESLDLFYQMMEVALEPFFGDKQPFDFSDANYAQRSRQVVIQFTASLKHSPPPRHIIFLHRKLGGIFNLVKILDMKIDLRPYWQKMLKS